MSPTDDSSECIPPVLASVCAPPRRVDTLDWRPPGLFALDSSCNGVLSSFTPFAVPLLEVAKLRWSLNGMSSRDASVNASSLLVASLSCNRDGMFSQDDSRNDEIVLSISICVAMAMFGGLRRSRQGIFPRDDCSDTALSLNTAVGTQMFRGYPLGSSLSTILSGSQSIDDAPRLDIFRLLHKSRSGVLFEPTFILEQSPDPVFSCKCISSVFILAADMSMPVSG